MTDKLWTSSIDHASGRDEVHTTVSGHAIVWEKSGTGILHACEGAYVLSGVRLLWTRCQLHDVPANGAWLQRDEDLVTCPACLKVMDGTLDPTQSAPYLLSLKSPRDLATQVLTQAKALSAVNRHGDYQTLMRRNNELLEALKPFAEAAKSQTLRDALSFGDQAPFVSITRGFTTQSTPSLAFAKAAEVVDRYSQTYTREEPQS